MMSSQLGDLWTSLHEYSWMCHFFISVSVPICLSEPSAIC